MKISEICDNLKTGRNFAFSRWGDGDWRCILGEKGMNCDGSIYYPDLGLALGNVLRRKPKYTLMMQPKAWNDLKNPIKFWCSANGIDPSGWPDADVLHNDSMNNRLKDFFEALSSRELCLVGPRYLRGFQIGDRQRNIDVPEKNAWLVHETVKGYCADLAEMGCRIWLFSCGMMAKVLIDEMHQMYGDDVTLIDAGSVLDYYVQRPTRRYITQMLREDKQSEEEKRPAVG